MDATIGGKVGHPHISVLLWNECELHAAAQTKHQLRDGTQWLHQLQLCQAWPHLASANLVDIAALHVSKQGNEDTALQGNGYWH